MCIFFGSMFGFSVVCLLLLPVAISVSNLGNISPSELTALYDLYNSTNGNNWSWKNVTLDGVVWNFTVQNPNPCFPSWQGLTCLCESDRKCVIGEVMLSEYNLVGRLPNSIGNLSEIQYLELTHNKLSGTIPATLGNLRRLNTFNAEKNYFTGTIPSSIGNFENISTFQLSNNFLNGTIPIELCGFQNLVDIDLSSNDLSGTFHSCLNNLTQLFSVSFDKNDLTGSLPANLLNGSSATLRDLFLEENSFTGSFSTFVLTRIHNLNLAVNFLSGSLPMSLRNCSELYSFNVSYNLFTESIPSGIYGDTTEFFTVEFNQFTGSLPTFDLQQQRVPEFYFTNNNLFSGVISDSICLSDMLDLNIGYNFLSGTLPDCSNITGHNDRIGGHLQEYSVQYNLFSGTIPSYLERELVLEALNLNNNLLTGTFPSLNTTLLLYLYLQGNSFTGPIRLNQYPVIQYIDVSNNEFSGTLPTAIFNDARLISFAAASNCLTGSISPEICKATDLKFLDLDGLSTADKCRSLIFPHIDSLTSFTLPNQIFGGIPTCLFSMHSIQTLHLSGNSIEWSFPSNLTLADTLTELSLSHNKLTGTIPTMMQHRQWSTLDLSFNKLVGVLDFSDQNSGNSLVLQVNRLSGNIPSSVLNLESINILTGNLFDCDFQRHDLPVNDEAYSTYQCGSNTLNQAAIIWICVGFGQALMLVLLWYYGSIWFTRESIWAKQWKTRIEMYVVEWNDDVRNFKDFIRLLCFTIISLTIGVVVVFLPLYGALTIYYKTLQHQYAWTVSAAFLAGLPPAIVLLVFYICFLILLYCMWLWIRPTTPDIVEATTAGTVGAISTLSLMSIVLLNCIIMVIVNGSYVLIVLNYNTGVIFVAQVCMALFKLLWNDFAVVWLIITARNLTKRHTGSVSKDDQIAAEMPYMTFIVLFNSIIAPCVGTAAVDSNCFYNVFVAPSAVSSDFPSYTFDVSCVDGETIQCSVTTAKVSFTELTYDPPFIYSYQCTSSILTNYASVYVFMFLMVAFMKPIALYLLKSCHLKVTAGSWIHILIDTTMHNLLKPPNASDADAAKVMFRKDRFVLRIVVKFAVFVTFGVIFPPLAVVICVAFLVEAILNLFIMGRFLRNIEDHALRNQFARLLKRDCQGCLELLLSPLVRLVVPFAAFFYAFFVFDTYGDKVGFKKAIWAPSLLTATPLLLWGFHLLMNCFRTTRTSASDSKNDVVTELATINVLRTGEQDREENIA